MVSNPFGLMKVLRTHWETTLHKSLLFASSVFIAVFLSLFYPLFLKIFVFFFPLLISTSVCCVAVYMFILSGKDSAKGVFFSTGENSASGLLRVYDEINLSLYNDKIKLACFFFKTDVPGDDEQITFAGKLEAGNGSGDFDEGVALLKVDNIAEGVWNYYLGRYSKWHYQKGIA